MANVNAIWTFVEAKLNCKVPVFIKNILEVCGYTNGMTIACIEDDDFEYFEGEVKNGNVSKYFGDEKDVLEGSNKKKEDFEFVRGHRKFVLAIRDLLKTHMDENGPSSFTLEAETRNETVTVTKKANEGKIGLPRKRKNASNDVHAKAKVNIKCPEVITEHDMRKHRKVIYNKAIRSLVSKTPHLFNDAAKEKLTGDFVKIESKPKINEEPLSEVEKTFKLVGELLCPYCAPKMFAVHHEPSQKNFFIWKVSNYVRHLEMLHPRPTEKVAADIQTEKNKIIAHAANTNSTDNNSSARSPKNTESMKVDFHNKSNNIFIVEDEDIEENQIENEEITSDSKENNSIESGSTKIEMPRVDFQPVSQWNLVDYSDSNESSGEEECPANDRYAIGPNEDVRNVDRSEEEMKIGNVEIKNFPLFRNGYSTVDTSKNRAQTIVTRNTCGFDSVFSIYACLFFDDANFRERFIGQSNFAMLVKAYYETFTSKTGFNSSDISKLYSDRNAILKEMVTNGSHYKEVEKNEGIIRIDCNTGIGKLFGQLCTETCPNIGSAFETKTCEKCKKTTGSVLPFISISPIALDLSNVQKSIRMTFPKDRLCKYCKGKCIVKKSYNNILALEVEPNINVKQQKKISIQSLTQTISVEKDLHFQLYAVIQFDPILRHFKSHIKRKNQKWMTYDDIQPIEIETRQSNLESEEMLPYMLFYMKNATDTNFQDALNLVNPENLLRSTNLKNPSGKTWKY